MDLKTTKLDGRLVDIISEQEYNSRMPLFLENPSISSKAAIEIENNAGDVFILPIRGKSDDRPGIYPDGAIYFVKFPQSIEEMNTYNKDNLNIVDFGDIETVNDFLDKNRQIRDMETSVLTDIDSVYAPPLLKTDSREMRAFKDAIIAKQCDINKYAPRFGDNFLNDRRILNTDSITLKKLISMSKNLDIEVELTLRDTRSDVANPMNKSVSVVLTGDRDKEE